MHKSSIPRNDLFIASKLPGRYHAYKKAIYIVQESLYRARLDYYDMYLIHWPNPKQEMYVEAWQALIDMKKQGLIRSIGVCNFLPEHIKRLKNETGVTPSINQIELHPYFNQKQQRKWNQEHNIVTQSWSPLGRANTVIQNKDLQHIADKHNKTIPQIILRWHYQLDAISIPKSSSPKRQRENINIFDFSLNHDEMDKIASLTLADGRTNHQDPASYEEF